jgi:hypothetical protein
MAEVLVLAKILSENRTAEIQKKHYMLMISQRKVVQESQNGGTKRSASSG